MVAPARQARRALLTLVSIRIDDVLRLEARLALLRVVRGILRGIARGAADEPDLARIISRHDPLPGPNNLL